MDHADQSRPRKQILNMQGAFAASNSSLIAVDHIRVVLGSGGGQQAQRSMPCETRSLYASISDSEADLDLPATKRPVGCPKSLLWAETQTAQASFSLARKPHPIADRLGKRSPSVAVGGDYIKPDDARGHRGLLDATTEITLDSPPQTPPHGYRSAVAYDPTTKTWITVGPNGTDISTDDGKNWHPLHPDRNTARSTRRRPQLERAFPSLRRRSAMAASANSMNPH